MRKVIIPIISFVLPCLLFIRNAEAEKFDAARKYSVEDLKEDLAFLKHKLECRNPNLYVFASQSQVDSAFDAIEKQIVAPMNVVDFYKLICPLTLVIRDGHTGANLPAKAWNKFFGKDSTYIPLNLVNIGDRLFSTKNLGPDTAMNAGDEILSIDGIPAKRIIDSLKRNCNHDGYSTATPAFLLSRNFLPNYSMFIGKPDGYNITFIHDSVISTHYYKAQPGDTLVKYYRGKTVVKNQKKPPGVHLIVDSATRSARLLVPSFDPKYIRKHFHQNFYREIRLAFKEADDLQIKHLIIDLRGNGGGDSRAGKFLLKHLIDSTFIYSEQCMMVKKSKRRDVNRRLHERWLPDAGLGKTHPANHAFGRDLYVLIDGGTFSASCTVSSCLRAYGRATFIGTETGGQQYRTGGYQARNSFTLPHTKIRYATSNVMTIVRRNAKDSGRGIIPDHIVELSVMDYIERNDPALKYTMELIRASN